MELRFSQADEAFRGEARDWLEAELAGAFSVVRGRGGPGDEEALHDERLAWERRLGEAGWIGLGWPKAYGGREESLVRQVIFNEEYARARAPGRLGHIGETLLGPTLIAFGTEAQKTRFLPPILRGEELWCQGYSEPNAGSDLANVRTRAERVGDQWLIEGQKTWTSGAHWSDWCFVLCRTDPAAARHKGLSYLLVPMDQPGVTVRPIVQLTGTSEFNEVFFDGARTAADHVVGAEGDGWRVAMGTLAFERGASTLGQQLAFQHELDAIIACARENGRSQDPLIRQRIAHAWSGLRIMRLQALRMLSAQADTELSREGLVTKLFWATWHRDLGELAMDVLGPDAELAEGPGPGELTPLQRLFLFSRADTIYAGSNEIQRNIIGERGLGLPRAPRPTDTRGQT
ncbi:MAG: acyl-CoA dehydrogenase family protein [Deltaproteobacteria bacterium]|nr:acyl-CoA dehydrogenase family protein [Deltaproteobacteria bacterium]MCB9785141.1 acyl-CoA dehydrogenase family protein [Deltaproteobacteria bacterium]